MNRVPTLVLLSLSAAAGIACGSEGAPTSAPNFFETKGYICPNGFTWDGTYVAVDGERSVDRNGDGVACSVEIGSTADPRRVYVDNNVPVEWTGTCPEGFSQAGAAIGFIVDVNRDRIVCLGIRPSGEDILVDNRF